MNKLYTFLLSLTLITASVSCKKETEAVKPDVLDVTQPGSTTAPQPTDPTGVVTPVGSPDGAIITATIGPAGGTIQSADKRVQISIPAGALTSEQIISVQPVTNHCPSGNKEAFRLLPHGLTFAKPATITFGYDDEDVVGSAPAFLRIAYQTAQGTWKSPETKSLDTTAHTLSVLTNHFSDWTTFDNVYLATAGGNPARAVVVEPGKSVDLLVSQYIADVGPSIDGELPVPTSKLLDSKYINKWDISDDGMIVKTSLNRVTYYAPDAMPAVNPVTVTVSLNKTITSKGEVFHDLRLVANIYVVAEGISISVDGGGWKTFPGGANINNTANIVSGKLGAETVAVGWVGKPTGYHRWTMGTDVSFGWTAGSRIYQNRYVSPPNVYLSGGGIRIISYNDEWIFGEFTLSPAGWTEATQTGAGVGKVNIRGIFRVRKV